MNSSLTREELLRRALAGGAVLTIPGLVPAVAGAARGATPKLGKTLTISTWPYYIDIDEKTKKRPTLDQFQRRYGVKVNYIEDVNDNASFFGKIQAQLRQGRSIGRDIIVLTDNSPYPALMVKSGWLEKLDKSALPNIKNLQDSLKNPAWDPKGQYGLPWQSFLTGIAYNLKATKTPVTTMERLLTDKRLHGKVTLLNQIPDSIGLVMLENGDDPAHVTDASFRRAFERIQRAVKSGQIRKFTGNDYTGPLARGDLAACVSWSGDVAQLTLDNKNLKWVVPKDGGIIATDDMLIPRKGDAHTASVFMNYYYDPRVAAKLAAYHYYPTPVKGVAAVLAKTDPRAAKSPLIFPTLAMRKQLHVFDSQVAFNAGYKKEWEKLLGA
jgi:spermidine/putrescine transport system substrate-binding protein